LVNLVGGGGGGLLLKKREEEYLKAGDESDFN